MEEVFLLWHVVEMDGVEDEKLIGVYRSESDAKAAIHTDSLGTEYYDCYCPFKLFTLVVPVAG